MTDAVGRLTAALAGRYEIERELGAGGMATVYLAQDVRHARKVALKVLRPELAAILGGERFLAEIKTTANLQHPHILSLFDSGEADGLVFYVMPFVDGESLRDRLNREKQLPVDEAVRIAREVADALQYAHEHKIVHRDIKPENILLHGGHALVADFGIALAASRSDGGTRMTETGMSLGTPHYMSPEQSMGEREITPRADIYALGCVLYEMLTAEPPFTGATAQAIIARVMTEEPRSLTMQRRTIPAHVEAAVQTALAKLPADRFGSAREFAEALSKTDYLPATRAVPVARAGRSRVAAALPWVLAVVAAGAGAYGWLRPAPHPVSRHRIELLRGVVPQGFVGQQLAISPDGNTIVFSDTANGTRQLWSKERDRLEPTALAGTAGGIGPVFSPDGAWIAFVADGKLKKVPRLGGSAVTVAENGNGAFPAIAWLDHGTIAYNNPAFDLMVVSQDGGTPRRIIRVDSTQHGTVSVTGLPGGQYALVGLCTLGCPELYVAVTDLTTGAMTKLSDDIYKAWYVAGGMVVMVRRDGGVFAGAFDLKRRAFKSPPAPVFDGVRTILGGADIAVGAGGTMLYAPGAAGSGGGQFEMVWVDRHGAATRVDTTWSFTPASNDGFGLSPDGRRLVVGIRTDANEDIWVKELDHGSLTRLTFDGRNYRPIWSADGRSVLYSSTHGAIAGVRERRADGTGPERTLVQGPRNIVALELIPDTSRLLVRLASPPSRDIGMATIGHDSVTPLIATDRFQEAGPVVSPDGKWLAYTSDESGRNQVFVRPFPDVNGGRWQVSVTGGSEPQWSHSGRELFYRDTSDAFISVQVPPGPTFAPGAQTVLFSAVPYVSDATYHDYAVAPHDDRFLFMRPVGAAQSGPLSSSIVMVENWFTELRQAAGGRR